MTLDELKQNDEAIILSLHHPQNIKLHLLTMGCTPYTKIKLLKKAPLQDPFMIQIRGYTLILRKEVAKKIEVQKL